MHGEGETLRKSSLRRKHEKDNAIYRQSDSARNEVSMNLPGFAAEASLYPTSRNYRTTGTHGRLNGDIYAAFPPWAVPFSTGLSTRVAGYLYTQFCCRDCANECIKACQGVKECVDYCLINCDARCDSYAYGRCKGMLGL
jgi:hypothetical protein